MNSTLLRYLIVFLSASLIFVSMGYCEEKAVFKDITAPEVKHMLDNGIAKVYNVLSRIEYEMQHITGSSNIPVSKMRTTDKLPEDKGTPVVFYCMGKQ